MGDVRFKWRVFSFLLAFCGLLLILLWLFQTVFLNDMYKWIRSREIDSAIASVREHIDSPELPAILSDLMREREIMVTESRAFVMPQLDDGPDRRGRPAQEAVTREVAFTLQDGRTLSLTFHAIITPVGATVNTLKLQLYIITGVMIGLSVGMAMLIAKRVSSPIEKLSAGAMILARGDYDVSFEARGFREIKELSDTLTAAARELQKVEGLRRELLANVSHDLRTPLSLIYSYAEMMHDFPGEIIPEQTEIIMGEVTRLSSLVDDMLDFSKLEEGIAGLNARRYNLTASLRAITERTAELVRQSGYDIRFEYSEDCFVEADEVKIAQAFYNLLLNAVHYSGADRRVTVRQTAEAGRVTVEVIDRGDGIAEKDLPYIWDRYYKIDKNHRRAVTGSGLGLSIVRRIFALHGADCGVRSSEGQGSTFWFELPTAEQQ